MLTKIRHYLSSAAFLPIPFIIGFLGIGGNNNLKMVSIIANVLLVAFVLFVSDDLFPALLPAFCVIIVGITMLSYLEIVLPYLPFGIPVIAGFIFHVIRYRRSVKIGPSFYGLCITSAAVLLSGIGTPLSTRQYTDTASIYHYIGLSVGLVLIYLFFSSNYKPERTYDPVDYFMVTLTLLGVLSSLVVMYEFFTWLVPFLEEGESLVPSEYLDKISYYRNTIATLGVMCLPSAFYLSGRTKKKTHCFIYFVMGFVIYIGSILTIARTAVMFGSILLAICLIYYLFSKCSQRMKMFNFIFAGVCIIIALMYLDEPISLLLDIRTSRGWISKNEARYKLLLRSIEDFLNYPIFGIGITSTLNSDIYSAPGCISWYHMYFPQLWGSMGCFGFIAYSLQSFIRAKLVLTKPNFKTVGMGLVYLGLFLYSQTDPGEFAPIPYAVLTVILFLLLDERYRKIKRNKTEAEINIV